MSRLLNAQNLKHQDNWLVMERMGRYTISRAVMEILSEEKTPE